MCRRHFIRLLNLWCVFALIVSQCFAQNASARETSLRVIVTDPNGAAIARARVQLSLKNSEARTLETNAQGQLSFAQLAPGKYRLRVEAVGFETREFENIKLSSGTNQIEIPLVIASVKEEVTVAQDKQEAATDSRGDAFSRVLTEEQIAQLPDDPDEFAEALQQMAGPGANFRVNGFSGGKLPPKSQIREIRFRTNPYAAENHNAGFISVDVFTRPGINQWHGSLSSGFRDESLNARNAFAPFRGAEQDRRFSFDLSGPLWKNHTSLFLSADGFNSYDTRTILAALPTGNLADLIRRPSRRLNTQTRIEHALTKTHTLRGEYQRNASRQDNLGVGNFDLPERAFTNDLTEHVFRLSDSGTLGKALFNELRLQTRWQNLAMDSLSTARTIRVLDAFTSGGQQLVSDRRTREIELTDNVDLTFFKKHALRAGFTLEAANYDASELRNQNGTFTFASLADFRANRPLQFSQRLGVPAVSFDQYQFGWYAQDEWRIRKNLTLNFGLRHELQTNLHDQNNFAPRAGLAWSPFRNGKTTIRAGAGIFYDWFAANTLEQILRVSGQQSDLIVRNPGFPDPLVGGSAITLPPSLIQRNPALQMPTIFQASTGIERELPRNIRFMTNYTFVRGAQLLRGVNTNAPVPDLSRPQPNLGNITQVESSANSFTHLLMFNVNVNLQRRLMLGVNYILSKSTNETDSPFSLPVDNFNLRAERGPALSDARHRIFMHSNLTLPGSLRLSSMFTYSTATPYNITTGFDNNGDAIINDRPAGVGRNSARGAGQLMLSTRISWGFGFGQPKENAATGGTPQVRIVRGDSSDMLGSISSIGGASDKRWRTEFFIQASNLLNHTNRIGFTGVQTSPFFGQATAALPGRRIESGMRFSF